MKQLGGPPLTNALSIDVEDYFQVSAFAPYIDRADWPKCECRIERNLDVILGLLSERSVSATFFTLGWIAERYSSLVRRIIDQGHELASHGYGHHRASDMTPSSFYDDVRSAKMMLEDIAGQQVKGYRAPSFSINKNNLWAYEKLGEAGYQYSSSIYPISHDHYGVPDAPRFVHRSRSVGNIIELPITTIRLFGRNLPASGGGYFRLLPYSISRRLFEHVNKVDRSSVIFYFHPWEVDPAQPRIDGINAKTSFRHYVNLDRMEVRLRALLRDFRWSSIEHVFQDSLDNRERLQSWP